jgi:AmmeMemoRadiSam system protein A
MENPTVKTEQSFQLSTVEQKEIIALARTSLVSWVRERKLPAANLDNPKYQTHCGGFVTLKKQGDLRGCIGYVQAVKPLLATIQDMVVNASTKDPRFPPVTEAELADIDIEISVLSPLQVITDVEKIVVGVHGLIISQGRHSGLLLPQVATEENWDRETFLEHTCWKAGLPQDAWQHGAQIQIFSAQVFGE